MFILYLILIKSICYMSCQAVTVSPNETTPETTTETPPLPSEPSPEERFRLRKYGMVNVAKEGQAFIMFYTASGLFFYVNVTR